MNYQEINLDGLVGPLHNYAGLSAGNLASFNSASQVSSPRGAALQGLEKMLWLSECGIPQAFIPPHRRPAWHVLESLGYSHKSDLTKIPPHLLAACCSASAMWTANAATICPSLDSIDKKLHILVANLSSNFHRSLEPTTTTHYLKNILLEAQHHPALPATPLYFDEGAANHTRLCSSHGEAGIHLFVYGKDTSDNSAPIPQKFPARQTLAASQAAAHLLKIPTEQCVFAQQSPTAIDAGVFHNDVICTGNENTLFYHQDAFLNTEDVISEIKSKLITFYDIQVSNKDISLQDAVRSYLFNSQILTLPDGSMLLLAPEECRSTTSVRTFIETKLILGGSPINSVHYMDLKQSMSNGGGPACLRLRTVLSEQELQQIPSAFRINQSNHQRLKIWVQNHYRETLTPAELTDPKLHQEATTAFDELEQILQISLI